MEQAQDVAEPAPKQATFKKNAHASYFLLCLRALPSSAQEHDSNRITIAYFCISGLDLLGLLEEKTTQEQRNGWIEWIWSLQSPKGGFAGSTYMKTSNPDTSPAHLPSTYTALLTLALLHAPLDRLNLPGLVKFLRSCQGEDRSFSPLPRCTDYDQSYQCDLRMMYCACAISSMISDYSGINIPSAKHFIERSKTWEGGYASRPGIVEAQGGTTYCAVASLSLLDEAEAQSRTRIILPSSEDSAATIRWCAQRQIGGFQGRPGKVEDVCYSFWIGSAISILCDDNLPDHRLDRDFLLSAQYPMGGIAKEPEEYPDPFHSYLAIAALSLGDQAGELRLKKLDARWNVGVDTRNWLIREIARVKGI